MALRSGYYGLKNSVKKALEKLAADTAGMKIIKSFGDGLSLSNAGKLSVTAGTANKIGGYKVGSGLEVNDGVLSVSGGDIDYSTTEQDIGIKWIDGRSVYKRVGQFANNTEVSTTWVEVPNVPLGDGCLILSVNAFSETGTYTPMQGAVSVSSTGSTNLNIKMVTGNATVKNVIVEYVKPAATNN